MANYKITVSVRQVADDKTVQIINLRQNDRTKGVLRINYNDLLAVPQVKRNKVLGIVDNEHIVYILHTRYPYGRDKIYVGMSIRGAYDRPTKHADKTDTNWGWETCYILYIDKESGFQRNEALYVEDKLRRIIDNLGWYDGKTEETNHVDLWRDRRDEIDIFVDEWIQGLFALGLDLIHAIDSVLYTEPRRLFADNAGVGGRSLTADEARSIAKEISLTVEKRLIEITSGEVEADNLSTLLEEHTKKKRSRLSLYRDCRLSDGDEIQYLNDSKSLPQYNGAILTVASEYEVAYLGKSASMTKWVQTFRGNDEPVRPALFLYSNGRSLSDIRDEHDRQLASTDEKSDTQAPSQL